jgi:hypothetical protein
MNKRMKDLGRVQLRVLRMIRRFYFKPIANPYLSRQKIKPTFDTSLRNTSLHDLELNFLLRILQEYGYRTVVEIGAFSGRRAADLKRLMPAVDVLATDLSYECSANGGVRAIPFPDLADEPLENGSLFFCTATMAAMSPGEIEQLIAIAAQHNADFAFVEPVLRSDIEQSIRRSPVSYFHPYRRLFERFGYSTISETDTPQKTTLDNLVHIRGHAPEIWRFWLAQRTVDQEGPLRDSL